MRGGLDVTLEAAQPRQMGATLDLDHDACYRAIAVRDARFGGVFPAWGSPCSGFAEIRT